MTSKSDAAPKAQRARTDSALFAAGLTSAIAGGMALNAGAALVLLADDDEICIVERCSKDDTKLQTIGLTVLFVGIGLLVSGIPMAIVGGKKVEVPAPAATAIAAMTTGIAF